MGFAFAFALAFGIAGVGVAHRDLKLDNVVLAASDFALQNEIRVGRACVFHARTHAQSFADHPLSAKICPASVNANAHITPTNFRRVFHLSVCFLDSICFPLLCFAMLCFALLCFA